MITGRWKQFVTWHQKGAACVRTAEEREREREREREGEGEGEGEGLLALFEAVNIFKNPFSPSG